MNDNFVLITRETAARIGNLYDAFIHATSDIDYGLRASQEGCSVWIGPGYVGVCSWDSAEPSWKAPGLSLRQRWRLLTSMKGVPPKQYAVLARRYAGPLWPIHWARPYFGAMLAPLLSRRRKREDTVCGH